MKNGTSKSKKKVEEFYAREDDDKDLDGGLEGRGGKDEVACGGEWDVEVLQGDGYIGLLRFFGYVFGMAGKPEGKFGYRSWFSC